MPNLILEMPAMKLSLMLAVAVAAGLVGMAQPGARAAEEESVLKTDKDRVSYALGVDLARNSMRNGVEIDPTIVQLGVKDALTGDKLMMSEIDLRRSITEIQAELRQRQARYRSLADINRQKGDAFLAQNSKKEGVTVLTNAIQYKVLTPADGPKPARNGTAQMRYRITSLEGMEIIASKGDAPAVVDVANPTSYPSGLKEVLPLMPVGSKWRIWLPPQYAYGDRGVGRQVGPKETVVMEVELVGAK